MVNGAASGTQSAVELALQERGEEFPVAPVEQADLVEELGFSKTPKVEELLAAASKRKGGRQAGTRNRRTLEWANYLLGRYTSPLEVLAQIGATPTALLAAALKCTDLEALQERRLAAIALAPYIHQKQAIAVDLTDRKIVHLTISLENGDDGRPGDDADILDLMVTPLKAAEGENDR